MKIGSGSGYGQSSVEGKGGLHSGSIEGVTEFDLERGSLVGCEDEVCCVRGVRQGPLQTLKFGPNTTR